VFKNRIQDYLARKKS